MTQYVRTPPETTWSKEAIEKFLEDEQARYQRFDLPYGITKAREQHLRLAAKFMPDEMTGKSFLDVGCYLGFYCMEAWKRGADRVVGVDINRDHVRQSRTIAEILGTSNEFHRMDIEESNPEGPFDYVIYLNVLHHALRPMAVLDRLIGLTRDRLILQVPSFAEENARRRLKRLGANRYVQSKLKKLPLIFVGKGGVEEVSEEQFYFSGAALRNLLMVQRHAFARIEQSQTEVQDRELLICHRRQVERAVMVCGPTCAGKADLIDRLDGGQAGGLAESLEFDASADWVRLSPQTHRKNEQTRIKNMLYEYDMLRPWKRDGGSHRRDEALQALDCCGETRVISVIASREKLIERTQERIEVVEREKSHPSKRLRAVLRLYEQPERLAEVMSDWLEYCADTGLEATWVDTTGEPRVIGSDEWKQLLA